MLEELRKRALSGLKTKLVVCVMIIAVCMLITKASFIDCIRGPIDLNQNYDWDVKELEGEYVTLDVDFVNMGFAEETSTNSKTHITKVTSICFVCEVYDEATNAGFLYAVKADASTSEHLKGVYDSSGASEPVTITGTLTKMTGTMLRYYEEAIEEEFGTELLDYSIPYCIYDNTIGGIDIVFAYGLYLVMFICIVIMVIATVNYLRGNYDRYLKKFLAKNERETMNGIESDYNGALQIHKNYKLGKKYLFYAKGSTMDILPMQNQVWAYYYQRNGKNSVSQIRFFDFNQKLVSINIGKKLANDVLIKIGDNFNHIVVGYDAALQKMFKNHYNAFLSIKYNQAKAAAATQEAGWNM